MIPTIHSLKPFSFTKVPTSRSFCTSKLDNTSTTNDKMIKAKLYKRAEFTGPAQIMGYGSSLQIYIKDEELLISENRDFRSGYLSDKDKCASFYRGNNKSYKITLGEPDSIWTDVEITFIKNVLLPEILLKTVLGLTQENKLVYGNQLGFFERSYRAEEQLIAFEQLWGMTNRNTE